MVDVGTSRVLFSLKGGILMAPEENGRMTGLAGRAYTLGCHYEREVHGCGQCLIAAVQDTLEIQGDELFKAATAFAGGVGLCGDGSCGAYLGGVLLLGHRVGRGRSRLDDPEGIRFRTYALARKFHDRFIERYGSVTCRDIHMKIFGRPYYLVDAEEFQKFEEAGGHRDKCPEVVGAAARWLVELMEDEGLIPPP